jgi:protein TonB
VLALPEPPALPPVSTDIALPPMEPLAIDASAVPETYAPDELDTPLQPVVRSAPVYPESARRMGVQGWVRVRFLVSKTGLVENVSILEAKPVHVFDHSVVESVGKWRFLPGTVAGVAVNTWVETTIRFKLD